LRYFFRRTIPPLARVLLVESGSRSILERMIPVFRSMYGEVAEIDVITCFAGVPGGANGKIYRVADYPTQEARKRLFAELNACGYGAIGMLCSAEPIMTKWKLALAVRVRAKILIVNENSDFFWFECRNWRLVLHFLLFRSGLTGASAVPALARLLFFPLAAAYLLAYAVAVHFRRRIRML
jgi:hypothetical protein